MPVATSTGTYYHSDLREGDLLRFSQPFDPETWQVDTVDTDGAITLKRFMWSQAHPWWREMLAPMVYSPTIRERQRR